MTNDVKTSCHMCFYLFDGCELEHTFDLSAAMDQITRVMAAELGPYQIRTNAINPTVTLTPMGAEFWGKDPEKAAKMKARIPLGKFAGKEKLYQTHLRTIQYLILGFLF